MILVLTLLVISISLFFYYFKQLSAKQKEFWPSRGFRTLPYPFSLWDLMTAQKVIFDADNYYYSQVRKDEKVIGGVEFGIPTLYVKDLELAKDIFIKDFSHFFDRRDFAKSEPLFSSSLFFMQGQRWKEVRAFMSPTFTSGRIRRMFPHFAWSLENLKKYLHSKGGRVRAEETMKKFAAQVIAASVFGYSVDVFQENCKFYEMVCTNSDVGPVKRIRFGIFQLFPRFANFFGIRTMGSEVSDYFIELIGSALKEREEKGVVRDDFLQLIAEAKQGKLKLDLNELSKEEKEAQLQEKDKVKGGKQGLDWMESLGAAFVFLLAGFDTVSGNLNVCLAILASRPDIQKKLFEEISSVDEITYESVNKMEFLEMFVTEVLRLYPAVVRLERKCMEDYPIAGTKLVIPKDAITIFSVDDIHRDPNYYENPLEFIPERFSPANKSKLNPYAYMPFGIGPRNCIGMRFALVETKTALAYIVKEFELKIPQSCKNKPPVIKQVFRYVCNPELDMEYVSRN